MTEATRRLENIAPWVAGLLLACPTLLSFYPPMTDLPFHEAAVALLRHLGDPTWVPPGLYVLNLGEPNQLFHMTGWLLSYVVSSRWAVKLIVAATVLAVPVCSARFARHIGASPLAALLVAPISLGWLYSWGLIANLIGLAALMALLPLLDRYEDEPTPAGAARVFAATVLLYLAHETMMMLYAGAALLLALLHPLSWRKTLARAAPLACGVALTVAHVTWQKRFWTPSMNVIPLLWHPLVHKLVRVPYIILPDTERGARLSMLALCLIGVGSFFWLRARERGSTSATPPASRWHCIQEWGRRHRWEVLAVACFAMYFAFPLTLFSATLIYQRWFPPAFAVMVIVAAPRDLWTRAARVARLVAFALPPATLLVAWPAFADANRAYQDLETLLPLVEPGTSVAALNLGPGDPSRTFSLGPFGGRVLATRGGRLDYAFTDSPISPVVIPKKYRWSESTIRLGFDCWAFRPAHDLKSFRYVIVRTPDPRLIELLQVAMYPEARFVATAGEWTLFESTLLVIPPASPPLHMDKPPPEQLRERVAHIVEALKEAPGVEVPPEHEPDLSAPNGQHF
jgi:hypothetical protein